MSQVFSGDAVQLSGSVNVPTTTTTTALTGNFLNPPFQNAKAIVFGMVNLSIGTGTTSVQLKLARNPNAENVNLITNVLATVTGSGWITMNIEAVDVIPDGRAVQYAVTVTQTAATANGTINAASIAALLISG